MKRILFLIFIMCTGAVFATTYTSTWYNEDGTVYDTSTCQSGGDITLPTTPTKYGYTFIGWEKIYTPIEYIENNGNMTINTGIIVGDNTVTFSADLQPVSGFNDGNMGLFQCGNDGVNFGGSASIGVYQNKWGMLLPGKDFNLFTDVTANRIQFDFTVDNSSASVTGDLNKTTISDNYAYGEQWRSNDCHMIAKNSLKIKLYSAKMYINNTLVRDMIPVLDPDGVPCMYDKVSDQFFYNAGTGSFIAGPVL